MAKSNYVEEDFGSVRWLNNHDGSIALTPILKGQSYPIYVDVSYERFQEIHEDTDLLMSEAVKLINEGHGRNTRSPRN